MNAPPPAFDRRLDAYRDLRERPRRVGVLLAALGELLERLGLRLQDEAAEVQYRKLRALRRWGQ